MQNYNLGGRLPIQKISKGVFFNALMFFSDFYRQKAVLFFKEAFKVG